MNQPQTNQQPLPQYPHYQLQDEIDLRELFEVLWKGKWVIIASTFICTVLAIVYALTAKEQWSSTARITQPQVSDYTEYQNQVMQFQPIFDIYQEDGTVLVSEKLDDLVDSQKLYNLFIDEFNASSNKKAFLDTSLIFQTEKAKLDELEDEDALRGLYNKWYQFLSITAEDQKNRDGAYVLMANAETSPQSFEMLNNYIEFVDNKVHQKALSNLTAMVNSKHNELEQQLTMLSLQAKQRLQVEKERSEYALRIAQAADVTKPLQNFGDNELFVINLGADGLQAKLDALSNVKNLSVIEPRLEQITSKLAQLKTSKINQNIEFNTYRFLDVPERNVFRDEPKRSLIAVLGFLLGAMVGIGIVLMQFIFKNKEEI